MQDCWRQCFKVVSQFTEVIQDPRQNVQQFIFRLHAIVEYDDGPLLSMLHYALKALISCFVGIEISAQYIPHDNSIMALQKLCLFSFQFAVRRPEQIRLHQLSTMAHIVEVRNILRSPTIEMIKSMVPYLMPCGQHSAESVGMFHNILPNAEECSLSIIIVQQLKNRLCDFGNRAIVKS